MCKIKIYVGKWEKPNEVKWSEMNLRDVRFSALSILTNVSFRVSFKKITSSLNQKKKRKTIIIFEFFWTVFFFGKKGKKKKKWIFIWRKCFLENFPWLNRVGGSEPPGPNLRAARSESPDPLVFSLFNHTAKGPQKTPRSAPDGASFSARVCHAQFQNPFPSHFC